MAHTMRSLVKEWDATAEKSKRVELWANGKITVAYSAGGFRFADDQKGQGQADAVALGQKTGLRVWDCAAKAYL